jgi:hypothetical protein
VGVDLQRVSFGWRVAVSAPRLTTAIDQTLFTIRYAALRRVAERVDADFHVESARNSF